jgi:ubiquinone/menaquinone biosynthesis C-methylase UbiE
MRARDGRTGDRLKEREMSETECHLSEEEAFWTAAAPIMFDEQRWAEAPIQIDQVISLLRVDPDAAFLDLCCGPGRHSIALARRGFRVTGVDINVSYLESARRQAADEGLSIEFVQADMRHFCRPDSFHAVINIQTSFGYFEELADDRKVLTNLHKSLQQGGALLLEMIGKEVLARSFQERVWHRHSSGVILVEERAIRRNWTWYERQGILLKDQMRHDYRFAHRVYSAAELSAMLTECGFRSVDVYGDLSGALYDHTAQRLVAVARR